MAGGPESGVADAGGQGRPSRRGERVECALPCLWPPRAGARVSTPKNGGKPDRQGGCIFLRCRRPPGAPGRLRKAQQASKDKVFLMFVLGRCVAECAVCPPAAATDRRCRPQRQRTDWLCPTRPACKVGQQSRSPWTPWSRSAPPWLGPHTSFGLCGG